MPTVTALPSPLLTLNGILLTARSEGLESGNKTPTIINIEMLSLLNGVMTNLNFEMFDFITKKGK